MARASLGSIFERRAKDTVAEARVSAETPIDDSPEEIGVAARGMRDFEARAKRPGEPDVQEIIQGENGKSFKKFLHANNFNIDQQLQEGDLLRLGQLRVEFLTAVHHAEYIKSFVTPEIVDDIITAGFNRDSESFKLLVDTVNKETLVKIVRDQMVDMAASDPARFEEFAKRIEAAALHKESREFVDTERHVRRTFDKYHVSDNRYLKLKEVLESDDLDEDEKTELLRKQVRSSKIRSWGTLFAKLPFGLAQMGIDAYLKHLEEREDELSGQIDDDLHAFRLLEQQERNAAPDEPEEDKDARAKRMRQLRKNIQTAKNLLWVVRDITPTIERMSSKGGAEALREGIEKAGEAVDKLEEQMLVVGTTLHLAMESSGSVRESMRKVELGEVAREEPIARGSRKERERNRSFTQMVPSDAEFQTRFDRYVAENRAAGKDTPREKLMAPFRAEERTRLSQEYARKKKHAVPLFGFLAGLLFATPGALDRQLDKKKLT